MLISLVAFGLDLPLAWWIPRVFRRSHLKRIKWSSEFRKEEQPCPTVMVDGAEEYEVEAILRYKGKGARHLYLVMWK